MSSHDVQRPAMYVPAQDVWSLSSHSSAVGTLAEGSSTDEWEKIVRTL